MISNILGRIFFWRSSNTNESSEDMLEIARKVGPLIDEITNQIFMDHREILVKEPITYIVPAVWGAIKDGKLTRVQKDINHRFDPVVRQVMAMIVPDSASAAQRYAIAYIIRGLMISKITFMIEGFKNRMNDT
ncbi:MAG: hypothetical protein OMM_07191 [Candidatus Magnetoglobus multicellularis str. Araruama]|uniref:Uncharacterized protein n=1 Tax=Candidatus Magnetoglobus multicellularis str. Araruama TaxID=890399 RepID=A0A1V1PE35_9BACT|nr:MAG: hypothetical protein OMM_07191 [Candidatus Magnetoglobus multicellularis str. Araruama]